MSLKTEAPLTSLTTAQLSEHVRDAYVELSKRADHEPATLTAVIAELGRVCGDLGQLYGRTRPVGPSVQLPPPRWMSMSAMAERHPGAAWRGLLDATWPSYRAWYFGERHPRSPLSESHRALAQHMPELISTWEHIRDLCADHESADEVAHMLTLWNPPPFAPGCSQLVVAGPARALIRNYDYHPALFEAVSASTQWNERRVIGTSDCLWGLLDGMNDGGLAVSLTYGGVTGTGVGFAIPLVVRYLLEVCETVEEAREVLGRMPVAGHYNLTMSDRAGTQTTAFIGPDRNPEFFNLGQATNHRGLVPDNPELARRFRSVERQDTLISLQRRESTPDQAVGEFLSPSLRSLDFEGGFGTLYTAEYLPDEAQLVYHWPGTTWERGFDSPSEQIVVRLQ